MKIVKVETIHSCGEYAKSKDWAEKRNAIHEAVKKCDWPPNSGTFTVNPTRKGNGVVPIKKEFIAELKRRAWTIEGKAVTKGGKDLGEFDAVVIGNEGTVVTEWETGNVSSSHRSMNKLTMLVKDKVISAGVLIVPARTLGRYLTDRIGNFELLEVLCEEFGELRRLLVICALVRPRIARIQQLAWHARHRLRDRQAERLLDFVPALQ